MAEKRLIDADDLLIAFGNALNNATLKIGYGFMEQVVNEQPTVDPESLRPTAKWIVVRLMADGAECKCGNCGRHETFTSFDRHTDHAYCYRIGDSVMRMTVKSYSNLMSAAAKCLRKGASNAGKE